MSASSNRSIFSRRINGVRRGPRMMASRLAPYGSMDVSRSINLTEQLNARNEVARSSQLYSGSTRLIHEQHFHDHHSEVELNIGGGISGSGSGSGSGVGAPTGIDLNVLPTESDVQGHQYCQCQHPILQETGFPGVIDTSAAAAAATATSVGVRPTNATSPPRNTRLIQGVLPSGSGNQSCHSPTVAATSTHSTVDSGWTLGETCNCQINVHFPQPSYIQLSNNINSQSAAGSSSSSSTTTVAAAADQNLVMANSTVHMVEQIYSHAQPVETSIAARSNQDRLLVGPMMMQHSRSAGANSVDPRFTNLVPHFQPAVPNPNLQGDAAVVDASDDENDELEFMQLDLEGMEYEDLLVLEEHIGNVNTGLAEEVIMERLVRRYYRIPIRRSPEGAELCCICLVEFKNRDVLGRIDCIHKYHFDCIKKWLMEKNGCPICLRTAILLPN